VAIEPFLTVYEGVESDQLVKNLRLARMKKMESVVPVNFAAENSPRPEMESVAFLAKALGDGNRLRILHALRESRKPVSLIVEELEISQPLVSHHLKELRRVRLVSVERQGPFVYYSLADTRVLQAMDLLRELAADLLTHQSPY
jgi:DNA-binding transcriptional ArsR family regulator